MKESMIADGYTEKNGQWTSPFTGRTDSFQPMREEYYTISRMGGIINNTPRDWMNQLRASDNRNKALMKQVRDKTLRENQLFEVFTVAKTLVENYQGERNAAVENLKTAIADVEANVKPQPKPCLDPAVGEPQEVFMIAARPFRFPWEDFNDE